MMTFIAFAAVAVASFLAGGITCVAFATWLEERPETPDEKKQAERDSLTTILDYTQVR